VEVAVLGKVDIFVRFGDIVDPYFLLPMSGPLDGWKKVWFFLGNDADTPLLVFTGSRPIRQPNWRYGVVGKDVHRLQPLREFVQQLLQRGLTGVNLIRTFFSHRVQTLCQREMTTCMYPGPSCPNHPFSKELADMEINTQSHRVLAHGSFSI
jgi:hypothetical protein